MNFDEKWDWDAWEKHLEKRIEANRRRLEEDIERERRSMILDAWIVAGIVAWVGIVILILRFCR